MIKEHLINVKRQVCMSGKEVFQPGESAPEVCEYSFGDGTVGMPMGESRIENLLGVGGSVPAVAEALKTEAEQGELRVALPGLRPSWMLEHLDVQARRVALAGAQKQLVSGLVGTDAEVVAGDLATLNGERMRRDLNRWEWLIRLGVMSGGAFAGSARLSRRGFLGLGVGAVIGAASGAVGAQLGIEAGRMNDLDAEGCVVEDDVLGGDLSEGVQRVMALRTKVGEDGRFVLGPEHFVGKVLDEVEQAMDDPQGEADLALRLGLSFIEAYGSGDGRHLLGLMDMLYDLITTYECVPVEQEGKVFLRIKNIRHELSLAPKTLRTYLLGKEPSYSSIRDFVYMMLRIWKGESVERMDEWDLEKAQSLDEKLTMLKTSRVAGKLALARGRIT